METNITEYGPMELAQMLAPMGLAGEAKLTFHDELSERVKKSFGVDSMDADFVIKFLQENNYLWPLKVVGNEKGAYILTSRGMELLRRYL